MIEKPSKLSADDWRRLDALVGMLDADMQCAAQEELQPQDRPGLDELFRS